MGDPVKNKKHGGDTFIAPVWFQAGVQPNTSKLRVLREHLQRVMP